MSIDNSIWLGFGMFGFMPMIAAFIPLPAPLVAIVAFTGMAYSIITLLVLHHIKKIESQ